MLLVALTAVLTSGVFSALVGVGSKQRVVSARNTVTLIGALWTGTFGADSSLGGRGTIAGLLTVGVDVGVGFVPLTITLVTMAATIRVFRRVTRDCVQAREALWVAGGAALLAGAAMAVVALVMQSSRGDLAHDLPAIPLPSGFELHAGPQVGVAFLLTVAAVAVVLAGAVLLRRDWLGPGLAVTAHDVLRAPLVALGWLLALTPVAGAVVALVVLIAGRGPFERAELTSGFGARDWLAVAVLVVAYAANIGVWALTLGAAGRLQVTASGLGEQATLGHHLPFFTGDQVQEPSLWICVAIAPLLLICSAYVVVRAARSRGAVVSGLVIWVAGLLVLVPLMVRESAAHVTVTGTGLQPLGGLLTGPLASVDCAGSRSAVCAYLPPALVQQARDAADTLSGQQYASVTATLGPAMLTTTLLLVGYGVVVAVLIGLVSRADRRVASAGSEPSRA